MSKRTLNLYADNETDNIQEIIDQNMKNEDELTVKMTRIYNMQKRFYNQKDQAILCMNLNLAINCAMILREKRKLYLKDEVTYDDIPEYTNHESFVTTIVELTATDLHRAAFEGDLERTKKLFSKGYRVNAKCFNKSTPLHISSLGGNAAVSKFLLDNSAEIEAKDRYGYTPLIFDCQEGNLEILKLLIQKEANIHATNNAGDTALDVAKRKGHDNIVELIKSHM